MEITGYIDFIKEQFKDIVKDYGFSWRQQNAGILFLEKKNTTIEFSTIYREGGAIIVVKSPSGKSYDALDLIEKKKIFNNSVVLQKVCCLNKTVINVEKSQIKGFEMIKRFL